MVGYTPACLQEVIYTDMLYRYFLDRKIQVVLGKDSSTVPRLKSRKNRFATSSYLSHVIYTLYMGNAKNTEHCSHVHSGYRWNNCLDNLMAMERCTNESMRDFASQIGGQLQMYAIVCRDLEGERILIELSWLGVGRYYFICKTPESYLNFQQALTGKLTLTQHTNLYHNDVQIDTPKQAFERTGTKYNHTEDMISDFWKWCDARDRLKVIYYNYPEKFMEWDGNIVEMLIKRLGEPLVILEKSEPATS